MVSADPQRAAATAGSKAASYADNVIALSYAGERRASEAVFANTTGLVCEGTDSNLLYVLEGDLVTPTLAPGRLAGIDRDLLLQSCGGIERDAPIEALDQFEPYRPTDMASLLARRPRDAFADALLPTSVVDVGSPLGMSWRCLHLGPGDASALGEGLRLWKLRLTTPELRED